MVMNTKPVPEMTSANRLDSYPAGTKISSTQGTAWHDVQMSKFALTTVSETFTMPAVIEPLIVWVTSGIADTCERAENGEWASTRISEGSLFITAGGAPYEFSWTRLSAEPVEVVMVLLDLALFEEVLQSVFGERAHEAMLQDVSGVADEALVSLLKLLRAESERSDANRLLTRGVAQAICVHLARQYVEVDAGAHKSAPALPLHKLRRITAWMTDNLAEPFSLGALAQQAGMSEYHFNRLFKRAIGLAPSQYQIKLRLDEAKRMLRETNKSIVAISNEIGYANPSHFSHLFRKESGLSPTDYRRQR